MGFPILPLALLAAVPSYFASGTGEFDLLGVANGAFYFGEFLVFGVGDGGIQTILTSVF